MRPLMAMSPTTATAIYAAVLSTAVAVWNVIRDRRDRPNLKLQAHIQRRAQDSLGHPHAIDLHPVPRNVKSTICIVLTVTNVGRRRVTVTSWGAECSSEAGEEQIVIGRGIASVLHEQEQAHEYCHDLQIAGASVRSIYVTDASGKRWPMARSEVRRLKAQRRKLDGNWIQND